MNERQAQEKGYHFHGAYSHSKEEMKRTAAGLREKGNKAIVVDVPSSKYSRGGGGMGYSVYWIESEENIIERHKVEDLLKRNQLLAEREGLVARIAEIDSLVKEL